jgi:hypothetical protein
MSACRPWLGLALQVSWGLALLAAGPTGAVIALLPLVVLLLFLLADRYPGEATLAALRRQLAPVRRPSPIRSPIARLVASFGARGGALIAFAIAGRGPPALPLRGAARGSRP